MSRGSGIAAHHADATPQRQVSGAHLVTAGPGLDAEPTWIASSGKIVKVPRHRFHGNAGNLESINY